MRTIITYALLFITISCCIAQQAPFVNLHTGQEVFPENLPENIERGIISERESVSGYYYRMIQFYEIPVQKDFEALKALRIQLLDYIPNNTYIAALPVSLNLERLSDLNVRSIVEINPNWKISTDIEYQHFPDYATDGDQALLMLKYYKNLPQNIIKEFCLQDGIDIRKSNNVNNYLEVLLL